MQSEKELLENQNSVKKDLNSSEQEEHQEEFQEHEEETSFPDVSNYSVNELLKEIQSLSLDGNLLRIASYLKELKYHYDEVIESEKAEALENFKKEGGVKEDFEYKKDEFATKFESIYIKLKSDISSKLNSIEEEKSKNLRIKEDILEKMRDLTSGEETSTSLANIKDLQNEWKNTGPVPANRAKELWANYNALVEMFYNNRTIYFELKELDRKKNYDSKVEVIERAEQLSKESNIPEAIRELRKLHEEYKNIGPVPKEDQEALWNRFKEASDKVYQKRNELAEKTKEQQLVNLKKKEELIEKAKEFEAFNTEEINLWKEKTKEVLDLQTEWKSVGAVPKERVKEISKDFWSAYKGFFKSKEHFFKQLEHQKKGNLQKKIELCEKAEELKDSENLSSTTEEVKKLQAEWSKVGPVPVKEKEEVFKRFKAACDHFFNRKREQYAEQEKEYEVNLKEKLEVISQIEKLSKKEEKSSEDIRELQDQFNSIGFVPKSSIKEVKEKYKQAVEKFLKEISSVKGEGKDSLKLELEVSAIKSEPNSRQKLNKKEGDVIRKMSKLKSDIQSFTTNIEFLSNSPKAAKLKEQVQNNIDEAQKELSTLKEQLAIIRENKY